MKVQLLVYCVIVDFCCVTGRHGRPLVRAALAQKITSITCRAKQRMKKMNAIHGDFGGN